MEHGKFRVLEVCFDLYWSHRTAQWKGMDTGAIFLTYKLLQSMLPAPSHRVSDRKVMYFSLFCSSLPLIRDHPFRTTIVGGNLGGCVQKGYCISIIIAPSVKAVLQGRGRYTHTLTQVGHGLRVDAKRESSSHGDGSCCNALEPCCWMWVPSTPLVANLPGSHWLLSLLQWL